MFHFGKWLALAAIFLVASSLPAIDVPPLTGRVVDLANVLCTADKDDIGHKIAAFEKDTGGQMAVLLVSSLDGEQIEDFSMRVAEKWKIGHKDVDNGLLFVAAIKDRKMRLEVGYGWEGVINDARAGKIIRDIGLYFKHDNYTGGIWSLIEDSKAVIIRPDTTTATSRHLYEDKTPWWKELLLAISCIVALLASAVLLGLYAPAFLFYDVSSGGTSSGYGSGGGSSSSGGGSSGGGGGFSGGGGSFGGGGASGDW